MNRIHYFYDKGWLPSQPEVQIPMGAKRFLAVFLAASVIASCAVGPDYQRPKFPVGDEWSAIADIEDTIVKPQWWQQFEDPTLTALVQKASQQNLSIAEARARVMEARAIRSGARGGFWPSLSTNGSRARQRSSENVPNIGSLGAGSAYQSVYDMNLDSVWEFDLFGRTQRRVESAEATYHATVERERDVHITVIAETAFAYFELRGAQLQLAAENDSYHAAKKNRSLIERRQEVGRASLADLHRADADMKTIDARLPGLQASRDVAVRRLSLLLGELPESQLQLALEAAAFPRLTFVPIGTRTDLLRRRPDVRSAERALAASTANIGVAKGEFYPKFSLVSSGGFESTGSSSVIESASRTWSVLPLIQWRLFEGGRIKADVAAATARTEQAAYAYQSTVLRALSEVEQGLINYHSRLDAVERQTAAVKATESSRNLIERQYRAGSVSLLILLDAQRQLNSAHSQLARIQTNAALNLVVLYKSLGGGWE